jgi:hypothetical protein
MSKAEAAKQEKDLVEKGVVELDGLKLSNTIIKDSTVVYSGGTLPVFLNVEMNGCQFIFQGAADNTLQMLRMLSVHQPDMVKQMVGLK